MLIDENPGENPDSAPQGPKTAEAVAVFKVLEKLPDVRSMTAARVLALVVARCARHGGTVRLSYGQIALALGVNEERVRHATEALRKVPDLEFEGGPGRITTWRLVDGGR